MSYKVGLVGVGAMGTALLHRMILAGMTVHAFDISEARLEAARKAGARAVDSPKAAAVGVDFVHVLVRTDVEVVDVALNSDGVLAGLAPEAILLLHSTILPETAKIIGDAAKELNKWVVDAPITAVPRRVRDGKAVFLTGGAIGSDIRVRDHLEALGKAVYHFGPLGSGNVAKLAKNLATAIERLAAAEVAWLAEKGGLDPKFFLEMMRIEHADPIFQRWPDAFVIEDDRILAKPATNLLNKDVRLASEYARAVGLKVPITDAAADVAAMWVDHWRRGRKVAAES